MSRDRTARPSGPSQRQLRVGELIRRRLSEVLARGEVHAPELAGLSITVGEVHAPELAGLSITVGEVRASPDLKVATAYVMPLGGAGLEGALEALSRHRGELRRAVGQGLALKFTPELRFRADETFGRIEETRRLFDDPVVRRDIDAARDED